MTVSVQIQWNCHLDLETLGSIEVHYMEKNPVMFSSKTLISFRISTLLAKKC